MKHRGDLMSGEAPLLAGLDLVKAHGRTPALRGASVALAAGEILAVTGASGSGKSTLLHMLAGIVHRTRARCRTPGSGSTGCRSSG